MLPTALAQDPDDVAAAFEEPPVERDEGTNLLDGVAGPLPQFGHSLPDVGAVLRGVDE